MEKDDKLIEYINILERLNQEKSELSADINGTLSRAKGDGYDPKAIKQVLKLKKMMPADRAELNFLVQEYGKQIGIVEE